MKTYFRPTFFVVLISILFSCKPSKIYEKDIPFKYNLWNRFDILNFDIPVKKAGVYDIILKIKHTGEFPFDKLPFNMVISSPSGEERDREYEIEMRNKDGKFLAKNTQGDIFEMEYTLRKEFDFNSPGIYTIKIENLIPKIETPEIIEIGLVVK